MKYKLISLSGLIHVYTGEAKEYPSSYIYTASKVLESQCVLVEDQERAKRFMYGAAGLGSFENDFPNWKPKDRTLYTVVAPEMERVEICANCNQSFMKHLTGSRAYECNNDSGKKFEYRTVMRFKEGEDVVIKPQYTSTQKFKTVPEAKESQEELWLIISRVFRVNEDGSLQIPVRKLIEQFHITRKP